MTGRVLGVAEGYSRRRVLQYGAGAVTLAAVPDLLHARWPGSQQVARAANVSRRAGPQMELPHPRVLKSRRGELSLTLTCRPAMVDMGAPVPVKTYTYDGVVPGYTWELDAGDTLRVKLINRLPPLTGMNHPLHMPMTRPHEWTTTNLHTHGLHVSPSGNADNVFRTIPPGERARFKIPIPDDHPAGLFWYHPHHHGAVTQQVRAGMAGAIIVRGDLDQVDEVRAAKEQIMVLQSIELGAEYQLLDPIPDPTKEQAFFPRKNVLYTVNGVLNPKITMYPGEVQRWRMVNAAEGKFLSLKLAEHELNVLAWDGLTLAAPDAVELVMMSAGNRVEALVKAGKPGIYDLVLTPGSSQKPNIPGMPPSAPAQATRSELLFYCSLLGMQTMPGLQDQPGELVPRTIATIEVRGSGPEMRLPGSLPAWDPPMLPIARRRTVGYTVQREGMDEFVSFGINGKPFDPDRAPYKVKLGTAEEWTIVNECDNKLMDHAHVFHIHVNPFKVTKRNGQTLSTPLWRDTYVVTKHAGDSFTFESNFVDFTGKFVEHCHVIAHEDLGMMEAIEVIE
jgi:FtsP/CotA-like multicopper oxidase with cupredoxin domain